MQIHDNGSCLNVFLFLPFLASLFACSLLFILACIQTLYKEMECVCCCSSSFTIFISVVLSRWLLYNVECLICDLMTYKSLRQFINMYASSFRCFVLSIFRTLCIEISFF